MATPKITDGMVGTSLILEVLVPMQTSQDFNFLVPILALNRAQLPQ
jgi:hypothetical protein